MCAEQDLRTVGRPAGIVAEGGNLFSLALAPKCGNHEQAASIFGTVHNALAVRRPVRLPIVTRTFSDLNGISAADEANPNVKLSAAIGTVSNEAAVRGPSRANLQTVVKGHASQSVWHEDSVSSMLKKKKSRKRRDCD